MSYFTNLLDTIKLGSNVDIERVIKIRMLKMEQEGIQTDHINWDHYIKVVEAKYKQLQAS